MFERLPEDITGGVKMRQSGNQTRFCFIITAVERKVPRNGHLNYLLIENASDVPRGTVEETKKI